jgi:eukaryotic-like serine/threonine-protein kinase
VAAAGATDDAAGRATAGRPESQVRMVLVRSPDGWRIETASRTG